MPVWPAWCGGWWPRAAVAVLLLLLYSTPPPSADRPRCTLPAPPSPAGTDMHSPLPKRGRAPCPPPTRARVLLGTGSLSRSARGSGQVSLRSLRDCAGGFQARAGEVLLASRVHPPSHCSLGRANPQRRRAEPHDPQGPRLTLPRPSRQVVHVSCREPTHGCARCPRAVHTPRDAARGGGGEVRLAARDSRVGGTGGGGGCDGGMGRARASRAPVGRAPTARGWAVLLRQSCVLASNVRRLSHPAARSAGLQLTSHIRDRIDTT